jgi:hypothetical protein
MQSPCSEELFYQLGLRQFGDYHQMKLQPPPPLRTLIALAIDAEEGTRKLKMTNDQITDVSQRSLLLEPAVDCSDVAYCSDADGPPRDAIRIFFFEHFRRRACGNFASSAEKLHSKS